MRWWPFVSALIIGVGALCPAQAQTAADFPNRRIHIVLPYPAGGIVDVATRIVTERLSEKWGQPIIVEAKPTASGSVAWEQVARAEPDGYTWSFMAPAVIANPRMTPGIKWNETSFVPIGAIAWAPSVVTVHPDVPANTMAEFIEYARKNPGKLNWANPGVGTSLHLNMAILLNATKLDIVEVQYRGQPPGLLDLLAGRVQLQIASIGLVNEHIKMGKLKALAVLGKQRSPLLPDVPTMSEAGFPDINVVAWYGLVAPRGTPQPVVDMIVAAIADVVRDPKVRTALEVQALQPVDPMSPSELTALVAADTAKYAKVIEEAGIKLGN
jgi:tripartite-type tricarboxylate transporter receptor subunit TctC